MENEVFWHAVMANDARFDGAFVLGVKTTGIYCKPSCRARLPLRKNVDFFATASDAESRGFRACLRCRPSAANAPEPQVAKVLRACTLMDVETAMTLEELGRELDLSTFHLQP